MLQSPDKEPEPLLSVDRVGEILGVSPATVYRLMRRGDLPPTRIGRRTLIDPADLRALIACGRATPNDNGPAGNRAEVTTVTARQGGHDPS